MSCCIAQETGFTCHRPAVVSGTNGCLFLPSLQSMIQQSPPDLQKALSEMCPSTGGGCGRNFASLPVLMVRYPAGRKLILDSSAAISVHSLSTPRSKLCGLDTHSIEKG